jgi:hypothetical protein
MPAARASSVEPVWQPGHEPPARGAWRGTRLSRDRQHFGVRRAHMRLRWRMSEVPARELGAGRPWSNTELGIRRGEAALSGTCLQFGAPIRSAWGMSVSQPADSGEVGADPIS